MTKRTPEIVEEILRRITEGESLRAVCRSRLEMPAPSTFVLWCNEDAELGEQYARAMEQRADAMFDELLEISDDARNDWMERHGEEDAGWQANGEHIQRSRLRVDTRKWALARMNPKKYSEKLNLEHSGGVKVEAVSVEFIRPK